MHRTISILMLVGGIVLLTLGVRAIDSFGSDVSRIFTGAPTDKAVWMMIGGMVLTIGGLSGTFWMRRRRD
jgi:hypothetical protein